MHTQKVIEQFGYKPNEAKVYLTTLKCGDCTVSEIAQKLKLPRTSIQAIVEKLHSDGLLNVYTKRRYKYWSAENPEKFLIKLKENEAALRAILPELGAIRHSSGGKPTIKVFSGEKEIRLIHDDIIATKHNILSIIPWDSWFDLLGKEYMDSYIERRVSHFLRIRLLMLETERSQETKARDQDELRETRFLPRGVNIKNTIYIYANKVAIISLNENQPTGILVDDPDTAQTMSALFEVVWDQSSN